MALIALSVEPHAAAVPVTSAASSFRLRRAVPWQRATALLHGARHFAKRKTQCAERRRVNMVQVIVLQCI
jgi:hypothetical protein